MQYLDSAAVDDWEGIWLLLGREAYCYLAIERINDYVYEARYTHRIVLWFDINVADLYTYPSGMVMGYLEQDLTNQTRRITLYDVSFWNRWFYWQIPAVTATAHLSGDRTLIMLDDKYGRNLADVQRGQVVQHLLLLLLGGCIGTVVVEKVTLHKIIGTGI